jgi:hypothetical protein
MKKLLSFVAAVVFLAACQRSQTDSYTDQMSYDAQHGLNGKMMAQHALMMQKEAAVLADNDRTYNNDNQVTTRRSSARSTRSRSYSSNNDVVYSGSSERSDAGVVQAPARRKGWSKAAKGAVIGGVTGAVAGAVISKNKTKGAIIGGILGAGGGYVIGRGQDKRDGRY